MSSKLLKVIKSEIVITLTSLINECIQEGIFPQRLKVAKVIPLFKKENEDDPNSYRPIAILPTLSKVLKKALYNRIYTYFTVNKYFSKCQFGSRQCWILMLYLLFYTYKLITHVMDILENKDTTTATFLDLTKAFDCVSHVILLKKLEVYGFRGIALQLLSSHLEGRQQSVYAHGQWSHYNNTLASLKDQYSLFMKMTYHQGFRTRILFFSQMILL